MDKADLYEQRRDLQKQIDALRTRLIWVQGEIDRQNNYQFALMQEAHWAREATRHNPPAEAKN